MKLIALVVEKYGDVFERQIFNFSDEFKVDFKWERRELIIERNPHYIKNFYGESIYNITPIVGINGTGKTLLLNLIDGSENTNIEDRCLLKIFHNKDGFWLYSKWHIEDRQFKINEQIIENGKLSDENRQLFTECIFSKTEDGYNSFEGHTSAVRKLNPLDNASPSYLSGILQSYKILIDEGVLSSRLKFEFSIEFPEGTTFEDFYKKDKETITKDGIVIKGNKIFITINPNQEIKNLIEFAANIEEFNYNRSEEVSFSTPIRYFMSVGEQNIIILCAALLNNSGKRVFVIDEIESGLHLEWSRKLIQFLTEFIEDNSNTSDIQIIFSTHSPYMLSDIKPGNIIALKKNDEGYSEVQPYQNTFAKNIQEIMHDDMFIGNIYGEFAVQKINEIIDHLNSDDRYDEEQQQSLKKEILLISEPLIRDKLLDMYHAKYTDKETGKEDEIFRLIAGLSEERKAQILEKLDRQQNNL